MSTGDGLSTNAAGRVAGILSGSTSDLLLNIAIPTFLETPEVRPEAPDTIAIMLDLLAGYSVTDIKTAISPLVEGDARTQSAVASAFYTSYNRLYSDWQAECHGF